MSERREAQDAVGTPARIIQSHKRGQGGLWGEGCSELCRAFWGGSDKEGKGKDVVSREVSAVGSVTQINPRAPHSQGCV